VDTFFAEKADQLVDEFPQQAVLGSIAQAMQESIRLTQQSLTLRKVMQPLDLHCEHTTYTMPKGFYVATLLSVLNTQPDAYQSDSTKRFASLSLSFDLMHPHTCTHTHTHNTLSLLSTHLSLCM
jgi:hypothetical protein